MNKINNSLHSTAPQIASHFDVVSWWKNLMKVTKISEIQELGNIMSSWHNYSYCLAREAQHQWTEYSPALV